MILNKVQKLTIEQLPTDENYTIGGVSVGETKRYEIHRVTDSEYKVGVFALMICLNTGYLLSPEEVIEYIETH